MKQKRNFEQSWKVRVVVGEGIGKVISYYTPPHLCCFSFVEIQTLSESYFSFPIICDWPQAVRARLGTCSPTIQNVLRHGVLTRVESEFAPTSACFVFATEAFYSRTKMFSWEIHRHSFCQITPAKVERKSASLPSVRERRASPDGFAYLPRAVTNRGLSCMVFRIERVGRWKTERW